MHRRAPISWNSTDIFTWKFEFAWPFRAFALFVPIRPCLSYTSTHTPRQGKSFVGRYIVRQVERRTYFGVCRPTPVSWFWQFPACNRHPRCDASFSVRDPLFFVIDRRQPLRPQRFAYMACKLPRRAIPFFLSHSFVEKNLRSLETCR